jgi:5'-3' exonuclease
MFTAGVFYYFPCAIVSRLSTFLQEPFECYHIADIESGLGLKRKQLVAMALLIGSDHDLHGVPGFGLETALRFVQLFDEDEILDKYVLYLFFFWHNSSHGAFMELLILFILLQVA